MSTKNQERYRLGMGQIIIEDEKYSLEWESSVEEMNRNALESMYRVQEAIYRLFGGCDIRETEANTINPAQQFLFTPLKVWNINLNNCFVEVRIQQRVLDGCFAEISII